MTFGLMKQAPLNVLRAGYLLGLIAVLACYGGTEPISQKWLLNGWLLLAVAYLPARWLAQGARASALSRPLKGVLVVLATLLVIGWGSALMPRSVYDQALRLFISFDQTLALPLNRGSVDGRISMDSMWVMTALVAALLMAFDMSRERGWRQSILILVPMMGVALACLGLGQKSMGDIGGYWNTHTLPPTVFGTFWYHSNAGAFLNLCWPLAAVGALITAGRLGQGHPRGGMGLQLSMAGWQLGALISMVAVWINVSKAAQAVFLIQIVAGVCLLRWFRSVNGGQENSRRGTILAVGIFGGLTVVLMILLGMQTGLDRWQQLFQRGLFEDGRWHMITTASQWLGDAGAMGFGPGTFAAVFRVRSDGLADAPVGLWEFAHNDYLQMALEWGWLGTAFWLLLGAVILHSGCKQVVIHLMNQSRESFLWRTGILLALAGVVVHAALDFPMQIFAIQLLVTTLAGVLMAGSNGKRVHVVKRSEGISE